MLQEKILNDYKEAMKQKDQIKSSTLSFLRAQMNYAALDKKKDVLDDADCITVIKKLVKQHQDSIEQFKQGNRMDLMEKEVKELDVLKAYLPQQIPADELTKIIDAVISSTAASGIKDMGKVMKEVNAQVSGRADGKMISDLVRQKLSAPA